MADKLTVTSSSNLLTATRFTLLQYIITSYPHEPEPWTTLRLSGHPGPAACLHVGDIFTWRHPPLQIIVEIEFNQVGVGIAF